MITHSNEGASASQGIGVDLSDGYVSSPLNCNMYLGKLSF